MSLQIIQRVLYFFNKLITKMQIIILKKYFLLLANLFEWGNFAATLGKKKKSYPQLRTNKSIFRGTFVKLRGIPVNSFGYIYFEGNNIFPLKSGNFIKITL